MREHLLSDLPAFLISRGCAYHPGAPRADAEVDAKVTAALSAIKLSLPPESTARSTLQQWLDAGQVPIADATANASPQ